jgi:glutamate-1-semialdehyde 2,1-aminomutase
MVRNGVFLPPSQFEAWFLSTALSNKDLKIIEKAIYAAMQAINQRHNSK